MLKAQSGVADPGRDEDREFRLGVVVVALDRSPPAQSLADKGLDMVGDGKDLHSRILQAVLQLGVFSLAPYSHHSKGNKSLSPTLSLRKS